MKTSELLDIIETEDFNVTLTGGDPIYQAKRLYPLIEGIKRLGKSVWIYTGFKYEELLEMNDVRSWLPMVEAVVDGPYIEALRDISLPFRGSSNQRIIYIKED